MNPANTNFLLNAGQVSFLLFYYYLFFTQTKSAFERGLLVNPINTNTFLLYAGQESFLLLLFYY